MRSQLARQFQVVSSDEVDLTGSLEKVALFDANGDPLLLTGGGEEEGGGGSLNWAGPWVGDATYPAGSVVNREGHLYVASAEMAEGVEPGNEGVLYTIRSIPTYMSDRVYGEQDWVIDEDSPASNTGPAHSQTLIAESSGAIDLIITNTDPDSDANLEYWVANEAGGFTAQTGSIAKSASHTFSWGAGKQFPIMGFTGGGLGSFHTSALPVENLIDPGAAWELML